MGKEMIDVGDSQKPVILVEGSYAESDLKELKQDSVWKIHDIFESQLSELFEINNPALIGRPDYSEKLQSFIRSRSGSDAKMKGNYVYYPWSGLLLHTISEDEQNELRINRTKNLVSDDEMKILNEFSAGIAGLSFGNGIALSLVYSGTANNIKIADNDIFETTNLNRVRVGLPSVNVPKTVVTTQEIYEINPYANVDVFSNGLNKDNLSDFINGENKLKIVFDVVDDFSMKIRLRMEARKARIPVVMLTSLEDSILVDIERFDLNPDAELFHGLLGHIEDDLLNKDMTEQDKARYAMTIVGPERVSYRNLLSLADVGTKLVSRPHLFGTVSIVCGLAAYLTKRIALGEDVPSMRRHVKFNEVLNIAENKDDTEDARDKILNKLMGNSKE